MQSSANALMHVQCCAQDLSWLLQVARIIHPLHLQTSFLVSACEFVCAET